ncbi:hypothetical protein DFQ28_004841 [Apophysomyces sp. BC1034]|nr:hypothetical protein DFQ30_006727 [Apophysomyces sp. BC1015]KAG0193508.1 hypothetical protein DFQ28_004841 [Apophysomyces sp. BC1034]
MNALLEQEDIDRRRRLNDAVACAEVDIVSSISQQRGLTEPKETAENVAGVTLAIGAMITNYTICFPIVVARHRIQALPAAYREIYTDTPMGFLQSIRRNYRQHGFRAMYPGFGLGMFGQAISAVYESLVNEIAQSFDTTQWNQGMQFLVGAGTKCILWAINVPMFPLYRNALILRVQTDSATTRRSILSFRGFLAAYRQDLLRFLPWQRTPRETTLPLSSVFIPSCIFNIITESMLTFLYKRVYRAFTSPAFRERRHSRRASSRRHAEKNKDTHVGMLHTFYPEIACSVVSSIITRVVSYPVDTILFKLMMQDSGVHKINTDYTGFFDCVIRTWQDEGGWRAFFPGWSGGILETAGGYLVLEAAWWTYRFVDWKLSAYPNNEIRTVRKARRLRERMEGA